MNDTATQGGRGAQPVFRPDRIYLGWQYALRYPDPGPRPPRPTPPDQQQLNPGWVAAQRREENLLNRPLKLACGATLVLAAALLALWLAGLVNPLIAVPGIAACLLGAALTGYAIWQAARALDARIAAEQQRLAVIRAEQEHRLFASQEQHARAFQDWQARRADYERQPCWYTVSVPAGIDRIDVAGGTLSGWSAFVTMLGAARLSTGGEITVIDLSEGAVAQDLVAASGHWLTDPVIWILPGDLARLDLGARLGAAGLADVLSLVVNVSENQATRANLAYDKTILERLLELNGDQEVTVANVTAALRALAHAGDQREDVERGLIDEKRLDEIARLFSRGATDRVVIERARALESQLRKLEALGTDPSRVPPGRLRVMATDPRTGMRGNRVLGTYVVAALAHMLRQARSPGAAAAPPWAHTVVLAGAEKLRGDVLDRLCDACEHTGTGLVLGYRTIPAEVRQRIGRGNAAVAFMRPGNADDAKVAAEQIGTERRFVLSQLTETVGTSVTDTTGDSYVSTVGSSGSVPASGSPTETSAEAITEGISTGSAWGVNTSLAAGGGESMALASQWSREFVVEQHELQQLPPSALIVSDASSGGRRVVLADANPAILGLPMATLASLDEVVRQSPSGAAAPAGAPYGPDGAFPAPMSWDGAAGRPGAAARWPAAAGAASESTPGAAGEDWPAARPWPGGQQAGRTRGNRRAPVSWKGEDQPPPNLGPPPDRLDWRKRRD